MTMAPTQVTIETYAGPKTAWCPGCGNFGILMAMKKALVEMQIEPHQILLVSGIGQAGKLPHYIKCNGLNVLHGRTLPAAAAAKIANKDLIVFAVGGDGDGYGEGGNHFLHAMRRNHDLVYLVHNNQVYGLTKGQASPTSDEGYVTKTTVKGAVEPVNPIAIALAENCSFIARSFSGDQPHLSRMIQLAIRHRGFALIDVLQPCVTFNKKNTHAWYRQRVYRLEEDGYNPTDRIAAFQKSLEWGDHIPIGVIYRTERPVYEDRFLTTHPDIPLIQKQTDPSKLEGLLDEFM